MRLLCAALAALLVAAPAAAEERITSFASDVAIQRDSSLEVTETIDVHSEGDRIRHGIYRDFPTLYTRSDGSRMRVGFTFEGAELDGHSEPASVDSLLNGVRMKIGSADSEIDPGDHRFVIRYRTTRQIGRFHDYDELYWNATGNGWAFPIDVAQARIHLPSPVSFIQHSAYTGAEGSRASNAGVVSEAPGDIVFRTTTSLAPYQGLTVAVGFPKGIVAKPDEGTRVGWWLADYGPPIVGALGLLGLLAFYLYAWHRVGRDPRAGTIVPLFDPPDDLSPAGMRYIVKENADNRGFAAALVDMGVRGHVKISEQDGGLLSPDSRTIERLPCATPLPQEEEAALSELASTGEIVAMKQANHEKFSSAANELEEVLKSKYDGKLFKRNLSWAAVGLALFLAALWLAAACVALASGFADPVTFGVAIGAAVAAVLFLLLQRTSGTAGKWLFGLVGALFAFGAASLGLPLFFQALGSGWWFPLLLPALALPIVLSAFWWMAAPTIEGRRILDHIAGFKQYLSIAERERLDRMTPPKDTPELFEKYLPYAIALGVENRWADRFAPILAAAAAQGQQGFVWYSGSNSPWTDAQGFTDSVGSSLASSVSSASTAPGSSSGSGGGGFSGGGGGGGGGGGW
jgi:uncharacterized membrane protein YgcG